MSEISLPKRSDFRNLLNEPREYDRLTVFEFAGVKNGSPYWKCQCRCGNIAEVRTHNLITRKTKSCGCLVGDLNKIQKTTHGYYGTPTYKSWSSLTSRCLNENTSGFHRYGGRGIRICSGFISFETFLSVTGERPDKKHSIDRIETNGHYSCGGCEECLANSWPMNVKWSTAKEQQRNRACNVLLTLDGNTKTMTEWSEIIGIGFTTLRARQQRGWSDEKTLKTPIGVTSKPKPKSSVPVSHIEDSSSIAPSQSRQRGLFDE